MRSPQEQEDFLQRGRFGEGQSQVRTAFSNPVMIGFTFIILGFLFIGIAVLFRIGRDDGGPFFMMGFFGSLILGFGCLLWVVAKKSAKTFKN